MNDKRTRGLSGATVLMFVVFLFAAFWFTNQVDQKEKEISWKQFERLVVSEDVESVTITQNKNVPTGRVEIQMKSHGDEEGEVKWLYVSDVNDIQDYLKEKQIDYAMPDVPQDSWIGTTLVPLLVTLLGIVLIFSLMNRQGGGANAKAMNFGKSRAKLSTGNDKKITFAQVAGLKEEKEELEEIVDFLKAPKKYIQVGARIPKGVLLVGPPGTGKTLLAKAVAGEAGVPFFTISGSDFVEMFVGVGASRVRDLFEEAKKNAPCIIFIDEIDAVARRRGTGMGGGHDEREQTLNQLLSEMDGFDTSKGIVILAATNRPEVLDKALLRPGRFDRRVVVEKPDLKGRVDTLKVHSKNVKMDETVDFDELALATSGAVGADLANMINEAALMAVKEGREFVSQSDLFAAVELVFAGKEKKDRILTEKEKKVVSYHEVGHALVTALQKNTEPVQKITIVPRTNGALGYVWQVPEEERYLQSKEEMLEELVTFVAGRAAEEIKFGTVTTGASNDIEKATDIARAMVTIYGMSEKMGMVGLESISNRYLDGSRYMNCSDETATLIDIEVRNMMDAAYKKACELLRENIEALDKIAAYLIEKETITGKEFMKLFNEVKGISEDENQEDANQEAHTEDGTKETSQREPEQEEPEQIEINEDKE